MKIVGTAAEGKLLIEATPNEVANLFGFHWEGELRERKIELKPGMEINASIEYQKLAWLRSRNRDFDDLVRHLRATANSIENNRGAFDSILQDAGDGR